MSYRLFLWPDLHVSRTVVVATGSDIHAHITLENSWNNNSGNIMRHKGTLAYARIEFGSFVIKLKRQGMVTETKARRKYLSTDYADYADLVFNHGPELPFFNLRNLWNLRTNLSLSRFLVCSAFSTIIRKTLEFLFSRDHYMWRRVGLMTPQR